MSILRQRQAFAADGAIGETGRRATSGDGQPCQERLAAQWTTCRPMALPVAGVAGMDGWGRARSINLFNLSLRVRTIYSWDEPSKKRRNNADTSYV